MSWWQVFADALDARFKALETRVATLEGAHERREDMHTKVSIKGHIKVTRDVKHTHAETLEAKSSDTHTDEKYEIDLITTLETPG